ncbi:hypothetical protein Pelo_14321 [Pelomyxa schiedti]|nr:hypothetical protein Pelo_14321 [Pelomyxa schiedti]
MQSECGLPNPYGGNIAPQERPNDASTYIAHQQQPTTSSSTSSSSASAPSCPITTSPLPPSGATTSPPPGDAAAAANSGSKEHRSKRPPSPPSRSRSISRTPSPSSSRSSSTGSAGRSSSSSRSPRAGAKRKHRHKHKRHHHGHGHGHGRHKHHHRRHRKARDGSDGGGGAGSQEGSSQGDSSDEPSTSTEDEGGDRAGAAEADSSAAAAQAPTPASPTRRGRGRGRGSRGGGTGTGRGGRGRGRGRGSRGGGQKRGGGTGGGSQLGGGGDFLVYGEKLPGAPGGDSVGTGSSGSVVGVGTVTVSGTATGNGANYSASASTTPSSSAVHDGGVVRGSSSVTGISVIPLDMSFHGGVDKSGEPGDSANVQSSSESDGGSSKEESVQRPRKRRRRSDSAPKRPLAAYLLFSKAMQPVIRSELMASGFSGGTLQRDVIQEVAKRWHALPANQKEKYYYEAKLAKDQWEKDMIQYEAQRGSQFQRVPCVDVGSKLSLKSTTPEISTGAVGNATEKTETCASNQVQPRERYTELSLQTSGPYSATDPPPIPSVHDILDFPEDLAVVGFDQVVLDVVKAWCKNLNNPGRGILVACVQRSGSGKTTLAKYLANIPEYLQASLLEQLPTYSNPLSIIFSSTYVCIDLKDMSCCAENLMFAVRAAVFQQLSHIGKIPLPAHIDNMEMTAVIEKIAKNKPLVLHFKNLQHLNSQYFDIYFSKLSTPLATTRVTLELCGTSVPSLIRQYHFWEMIHRLVLVRNAFVYCSSTSPELPLLSSHVLPGITPPGDLLHITLPPLFPCHIFTTIDFTRILETKSTLANEMGFCSNTPPSFRSFLQFNALATLSNFVYDTTGGLPLAVRYILREVWSSRILSSDTALNGDKAHEVTLEWVEKNVANGLLWERLKHIPLGWLYEPSQSDPFYSPFCALVVAGLTATPYNISTQVSICGKQYFVLDLVSYMGFSSAPINNLPGGMKIVISAMDLKQVNIANKPGLQAIIRRCTATKKWLLSYSELIGTFIQAQILSSIKGLLQPPSEAVTIANLFPSLKDPNLDKIPLHLNANSPTAIIRPPSTDKSCVSPEYVSISSIVSSDPQPVIKCSMPDISQKVGCLAAFDPELSPPAVTFQYLTANNACLAMSFIPPFSSTTTPPQMSTTITVCVDAIAKLWEQYPQSTKILILFISAPTLVGSSQFSRPGINVCIAPLSTLHDLFGDDWSSLCELWSGKSSLFQALSKFRW